jgi:hypothetical protein
MAFRRTKTVSQRCSQSLEVIRYAMRYARILLPRSLPCLAVRRESFVLTLARVASYPKTGTMGTLIASLSCRPSLCQPKIGPRSAPHAAVLNRPTTSMNQRHGTVLHASGLAMCSTKMVAGLTSIPTTMASQAPPEGEDADEDEKMSAVRHHSVTSVCIFKIRN